jgi:hypothetical protein
MAGDYATTDELTAENARLRARVAELEEAVREAPDLAAAELAQPGRRTRTAK